MIVPAAVLGCPRVTHSRIRVPQEAPCPIGRTIPFPLGSRERPMPRFGDVLRIAALGLGFVLTVAWSVILIFELYRAIDFDLMSRRDNS